MSNVGEPRTQIVKQDKNSMEDNKTAIKIVKAPAGGGGPGGIGVGIVFLGGAVATAAFMFIKRRRQRIGKAGSKSNNNCKEGHDQSTMEDEIPYKFIEDKYMNEDKGLRFVASVDQDDLKRNGNGTSGKDGTDNPMIQHETCFFLDEKDKLKFNGKKNEDPVAVGQDDYTHSISPEELESCMQFDASALKEKEFQTPIIVEDETLVLPTILENELAEQEIADIKEEVADIKQGVEEDSQDVIGNTEEGKMDSHGWEEEDNGGLQSQDGGEEEDNGGLQSQDGAEEADGSMLDIMQSGQEQVSPTDGGEVTFQPLSGNSFLSCNGNLDDEGEGSDPGVETAMEKDEELEAANEEQAQDGTTTQIIEVQDAVYTEDFEKQDACFEDKAVLMFAEEEKCDQHDSSMASRTENNEELGISDQGSHGEGNSEIQMPEEGENLKEFQVALQMNEALEIAEEVTVPEEAEVKEQTEILLGGEEKGADQDDSEMAGEQSQETSATAQLPNDSSSNNQEPDREKIETSLNGYQEDNSATDETTFEHNPCANIPNVPLTLFNALDLTPEIHANNSFAEIQQSAEPNELRKEESEDLPIQLDEKQESLNDECEETSNEADDTVQLKHESNITSEEQKLMITGEDANNETDESSNAAKKEDQSSEGTADSSAAESNAEPIWPAESIQDLTTELENEIPLLSNEDLTVDEQEGHLKKLEEMSMPENNGLQKGNDEKDNSKLNLLERYKLQLVEQIHQTTNSQKRKILVLTIMALSGSFCSWYFDSVLPALKICLIIILLMIIAKMHEI